MSRVGVAAFTVLCALGAAVIGGKAEPLRVNALIVRPEFRGLVNDLRTRTKLPIVVPKDMRWAPSGPTLVACLGTADAMRYGYFVVMRDLIPKCYSDPMFQYLTLSAEPWSGPFVSYGARFDLGRGVDSDVSFATGFDDPGVPRNDVIVWHLGTVRFTLLVSHGDAVALARSIVENLKVTGPSHHLNTAPPIGTVPVKQVDRGLAEGVAALRRQTTLPIVVPELPSIDSSIELFAQRSSQTQYEYFLCRTIACDDRSSVVAEVAADADMTPSSSTKDNVSLGCGMWGNFQAASETSRFAFVGWHQWGTDFSVVSAIGNPSHTDVVVIARSIVANACAAHHAPGGR